jgi:L-arabinokinase
VLVATLDPVPQLLNRLSAELAAAFDPAKPIRISRAPGRLDVMGGIADYTGSLVCEATLDRAAAVALQPRADRQVQIFSFNLFDEHLPFTFNIPLDALIACDAATLAHELSNPGRKWAGYLVGCLYLLHESGLIDLRHVSTTGLNFAVLSNVPLGAGVSSSAALEVATMMNLIDHFALRERVDPMQVAAMCQAVENRIVGAPCGIMDQVSSLYGHAGALLRMICQPHEIQPPLFFPANVRAIGINSNVKHSVGGGMYGKTRCAAFMGHTMIVNKMREMGQAAGRPLLSDPMRGYLANLDPDDYKRLFRPFLPESIEGGHFLANFGPTVDTATAVLPQEHYHVRQATDHHVLEAQRVRRFVQCISDAQHAPVGSGEQSLLLDKAGHLMYGSHQSYTNDALLGADECDLLVKLVRERERDGLYGAKITGGGSGGTVAVLCDISDRADGAIAEIMREYQQQTGRQPQAFLSSSPGAWHAGTFLTQS